MESITITPDSTGFAAKLDAAQKLTINEITKLHQPTTAPHKFALLADINLIVQSAKVVKLMGDIVTELQELKIGSASHIQTWIDESGTYYQSITTGDTIRTYTPSGHEYIPTGNSRPVNNSDPGFGIEAIHAPSKPGFTYRRGTEQVVVATGAQYISIAVMAGEVSCSNGEGVLLADSKLEFTDEDGLTELIFNGDVDAEYLVSTRYPVKKEKQNLLIEPADFNLEMTADLLPSAHELVADLGDVTT